VAPRAGRRALLPPLPPTRRRSRQAGDRRRCPPHGCRHLCRHQKCTVQQQGKAKPAAWQVRFANPEEFVLALAEQMTLRM
jgi:hypothetical protein